MSEEPKNTQRVLTETLTDMIEQLVDFRHNTWTWVEQPHKLKDTKARQKEFQEISKALSALSVFALKQKREGEVAENVIDADLRIVEIARGYEAEIRDCLKADYYSQKKKSPSEVDVVKNVTFLFGLPAAFVTGVKNGVGDGHVGLNEALVLGFAISIPTVFHKTAIAVFSKAAKAVCSVPGGVRSIPAYVGSDMRVVYMREIIKEKAEGARVCFSSAAKSINDNVGMTKRQTTSLMKRVFGRRGPRP